MFTITRAGIVEKKRYNRIFSTTLSAVLASRRAYELSYFLLTLTFLGFTILFVTAPFVQAQDANTESTTTASSSPTILPPQPGSYPLEGIPGGDGIVGDFVVGPGKVDLTLKAGETRIVEMIVTNRTGERRIFNLTTEDAVGSSDINTPIVLLGSDRGPYSLKDYLTFEYSSFELGQNERARIPVTISIPEDAEPGGLYGSVLVDTIAIKADGGETTNTVPQSAIIARIGTLFFITVPGDVAKEGALKNFATIPEKQFFQGGPLTFGIYYENTGSIHLAPYGEIRITNMMGEEVDFVQLEPWFVLPQSQRLREVGWEREFLFGKYTATAHINKSYDDAIDTMSFTFWVLPWKIVLAAFALVFVIVFIIRAFFRNFEFKKK